MLYIGFVVCGWVVLGPYHIKVSIWRIMFEWSFDMKFMKQAFGSFCKFVLNDHECKILFIIF